MLMSCLQDVVKDLYSIHRDHIFKRRVQILGFLISSNKRRVLIFFAEVMLSSLAGPKVQTNFDLENENEHVWLIKSQKLSSKDSKSRSITNMHEGIERKSHLRISFMD